MPESIEDLEQRLRELPDDAATLTDRVDILFEMYMRLRRGGNWGRIEELLNTGLSVARRGGYSRGISRCCFGFGFFSLHPARESSTY